MLAAVELTPGAGDEPGGWDGDGPEGNEPDGDGSEGDEPGAGDAALRRVLARALEVLRG